MATISLSTEASKGLLEQGFVSRVAQLRDRFESIGGTLDSHWVTAAGELVIVHTMPDSWNPALLSVQNMASGKWNVLPTITEIFDSEEMDTAIAASQIPTLPMPGNN